MKMTPEELEQRRIDSVINHFEDGCLCLLTGKLAKATTHDQKGIDYYMTNYTCTRHPESSPKDCWDSNLSIVQKIKLVNNYETKK